jgi:hypothetical protein
MDEASFSVKMEVKGIEDIDSLEQHFSDAVNSGMRELKDVIEEKWKDLAEQQLDTSKEEYLKGLSVQSIDNDVFVELTGWLPVSVETGADRFDMKKTLLGDKVSKVIPFDKGGGQVGFRTITQNSDGWWHPGIQAKSIYSQVQDALDEDMLEDVFKDKLTTRTNV